MLKLQSTFHIVLIKILERNIKGINIPIEISCQSLKMNKNTSSKIKESGLQQKYLIKIFLNLYRNKLKQDMKSCLNFVRSIISSPNKKNKELAILLNDFVIDQTTDFLIFQDIWH